MLQVLLLSAVAIFFGVMAVFTKNWHKKSANQRILCEKRKLYWQIENERREMVKMASQLGDLAVTKLSFKELCQKLQSGQLSAVEVLHAYQKAALLSTERTNAVTEFIDPESAGLKAAHLDALPRCQRRVFHGIPVSVKESFFVTGTNSTCGLTQYIGQACQGQSADLVRFLENLGCIVFCKTNIPQLLWSFDSRNPAYGLTANPHNPLRSPGGSSSGEGALIGSRSSILGVGSDLGGSLRIPAAWCGCFSLKTTSSRTLEHGTFPSKHFPHSLVRDFLSNGFMTQDAESLVTLHRHLYSKCTFSQFPFGGMAPIEFQEHLFILPTLRPLTIGYCDCDGIVETVPAMKKAISMAKRALEKRGHKLVKWRPQSVIFEGAMLYFYSMAVDGVNEVVQALEQDIEVSLPNKMTLAALKIPSWAKPLFSLVVEMVFGKLPAQLSRQTSERTEWSLFKEISEFRRKFSHEFSNNNLDALLWPSFATPAVLVDAPRDVVASVSYTGLFNVLDWPAGVCPVTEVTKRDEEQARTEYPTFDAFHKAIKKSNIEGSVGLPVAVQIAGPQFQDELVLALMVQLQESLTDCKANKESL